MALSALVVVEVLELAVVFRLKLLPLQLLRCWELQLYL